MFIIIKLLCLGMVSSSLAWLALSVSGWLRDRTRRDEIAELKLEVERLTRELAIQSKRLEFMGATVCKARFEQGVQKATLNRHECGMVLLHEYLSGIGSDVADQAGRLRMLESRFGVVSFEGVGEIEPVFTREV